MVRPGGLKSEPRRAEGGVLREGIKEGMFPSHQLGGLGRAAVNHRCDCVVRGKDPVTNRFRTF